MDLHSAMIDERWLRRFMARLLSFADLAEQAAGRSAPIRWLVLWILRRAEALMEDVVFDVTGALPPALEGFAAVGNGRADALRLAARFRALAAMLALLLPAAWFSAARRRDRRLDDGSGLCCFAFGPVAPGSGRPLGGWTPNPNDTS